MSYGVGHKHGLDPALLQLWYRPAAIAPIRPLAWKPPYAKGRALKSKKEKEKEKKKKKRVKVSQPASKLLGMRSDHGLVDD